MLTDRRYTHALIWWMFSMHSAQQLTDNQIYCQLFSLLIIIDQLLQPYINNTSKPVFIFIGQKPKLNNLRCK